MAVKSAARRIAALPNSDRALIRKYLAKSPGLAMGWDLRATIDAAVENQRDNVTHELASVPISGLSEALSPFLHGLLDTVRWSGPTTWRLPFQPILRLVNAGGSNARVTTLRQRPDKAHQYRDVFDYPPTQSGSSTRHAIAKNIEQAIVKHDLSLDGLSHLVMDALAVIDPHHAQNGQPGTFPSGQVSRASYMFLTWQDLAAAPVPTAWMPTFGVAPAALIWELALIRTLPVGIVPRRTKAEGTQLWPTEFAAHDLSHIALNNNALGQAPELWTNGRLQPVEQGLKMGAQLAASIATVPKRRLRNEIHRMLALLVYEGGAAPSVKSLSEKIAAADSLLEHEKRHADAATWTAAKDWLSDRFDRID